MRAADEKPAHFEVFGTKDYLLNEMKRQPAIAIMIGTVRDQC